MIPLGSAHHPEATCLKLNSALRKNGLTTAGKQCDSPGELIAEYIGPVGWQRGRLIRESIFINHHHQYEKFLLRLKEIIWKELSPKWIEGNYPLKKGIYVPPDICGLCHIYRPYSRYMGPRHAIWDVSYEPNTCHYNEALFPRDVHCRDTENINFFINFFTCKNTTFHYLLYW